MLTHRPLALLATLFGVTLAAAPLALQVEVLRSVGGLPPHVVGVFEDAIDFEQGPDGSYFVFDRRGHAVYAVDAARTAATKDHRSGG